MTDVATNFKARLFHVFRTGPIYDALIDILSDPAQDLFDACDFLLAHHSVDTAEGEQLDFIGELIGIRRPLQQETRLLQLYRFGELPDPENLHGLADDSDATVTTGGYMGTYEGLVLQPDPEAQETDTNYRYLIKQKGTTYRKRMTASNLETYLEAFGARCILDESTTGVIEIDPLRWNDLTDWDRYYIIYKGFRPAGLEVRFRGNVRHEDSI